MKNSIVFPFEEGLQFNSVKEVQVKLLDSVGAYQLIITHDSGNVTYHFMPVNTVWYTQAPVRLI